MILLASLHDWFRELRLQKVRTFSTVMGIAWGTFGVVGIMAFGRGLEDLMHERAQGIGRGLVVVWPRQTTRPFAGYSRGRAVNLTEEDVAALEAQVPELDAICPEYVRWETVETGGQVLSVPISGIRPPYRILRNLAVEPGGRFIDDRDVREERRVAFLGDLVKRQLFGDEPAVGRTVRLLGAQFKVIGVMRPKLQDSNYEGQDENRICIPTSTFRQVTGDRLVDYFVYRAREREQTAAATANVYQVLGRRLKFDPADLDALRVLDTTEFDRIREISFLAMDSLITLACFFTLLVGGIGVGNLMFLVVRRRTREIGIRLAVGARPRWILQEVLVQALILVAVGGAIGFLGAWGLAVLIGATPAAETLGVPRISMITAVGTVTLLAVIGLAAGWFPARRASRLDPVRALND